MLKYFALWSYLRIAHKEQMSKIMDYGFDCYLTSVFIANQEIIIVIIKCIIYE